MGEYTGRIEIARPPAEVFAFVADLRQHAALPADGDPGRPAGAP